VNEFAVSVDRRIAAPAATIFAVLCDPANHVTIDGSGMLRSTAARPLSGIGDTFVVEMWNPNMDDYEITNLVVDFEPDRVIRWQPLLTRASRPEAQERVGVSAKHRWGYELRTVGDAVTDVTQTFDVIESPDWLKEATDGGKVWIDTMTASLEKLAGLFGAS
jgi:hypothetical protein